MPLLKHWNEQGALWGIWKVSESAEELHSLLSPLSCDEEELLKMKSPARRLEYLAVRVLLYALVGEECAIAHHPSGKPFLPNSSYHISISHTKGYVAVGLHPTHEVGIDIEYVAERVRKVTTRFVRPDELPELEKFDSASQLYELLLVWSAKETIFKVMNASEVDFLEHIRILPFELLPSGHFNGCEYRTVRKVNYIISYFTHPDFVCTYVVS